MAEFLAGSPAVACLLMLLLMFLLMLLAGSADAVVIDSGDGSGNTTPPNDDPGLVSVGIFGQHTGIYLGNRWTLTANHVATGAFTVNGQTYLDVAGSKHRLTTPGVGLADLKLVKIDGDPGLPSMKIASSSPPNNGALILQGKGWNRLDATSWEDNGGTIRNGYNIGGGATLRWGTNRKSGAIAQPVLDTTTYYTDFDQGGGTSDECQAAPGDSGGAVFYKRGGTWELSGVMFATNPYVDQPAGLVLDGNLTLIADLSDYQSEILGVINTPTCNDGLDDDGDGLTDYPADPGCSSATDDDERDANLICDNGIDEDGDGLIDWPTDPGCADSSDDSEQSSSLICDDGIDNEGDGLTDYPEDPDCTSPTAPDEGPAPYVPVTSGIGAGLLAALIASIGGRKSASARS